jgi:signal transduction histidine kinase
VFTSANRDPRRHARAVSREIVAVGVTFILAMWSAVAISIVCVRDAAMDRTRSEGRNLAVAFADEMTHILDGVGGAMELVAARMRAARGRFDIYAWAHEIPLLSSATIQGAIIGPDGRLVSTTLDPAPQPIDLSDREHFRAHVDGTAHGIFIGKPVTGRVSHQVTINVTRRVDAEDGTFLGVIMFALAPANLTTLNTSIDLGPRGSISLLGFDDIIRARFTRDDTQGLAGVGQRVDHPWTPSIPANGEGAFIKESVIDHVTRLFSYRRVADYPLVVTVGLGLDEALMASDEHARAIVAIAGLATILLVGLAAYLIREIRRSASQETALADERDKLNHAQRLAKIGSFERDFRTGEVVGSEELHRIFALDPRMPMPTRDEFLALVHPDDRAIYEASMRASEQGLSAPPLTYRFCCYDGSTKWLYTEIETIFDDEGRPVRRIGTIRDVTEAWAIEERQKELERQLLHSQKLDALGTLAGGIAHDLNNTLMPILALSELLMRQMPEGSAEREDLETVVQASRHGRDLVGRILAFSRDQEAVKSEVDLAAVTREALQMLRPTIPTTILIDEEIESVPLILADAGQLQQVIVNLVTNARQAIDGDLGRITIGVSRSSRRSTRRHGANFVRLSVADSGCGMTAETKERIFEPFFTTKNVGEGTGLGLSVVHGIVADHGGRIEVKSQLGKGTEFNVLLPVAGSMTSQIEVAA